MLIQHLPPGGAAYRAVHGNGWTDSDHLLANIIDALADLQAAVYRTAPALPKGSKPPRVPRPKRFPRPGQAARRAQGRIGDTSQLRPGQARRALDRLKPPTPPPDPPEGA